MFNFRMLQMAREFRGLAQSEIVEQIPNLKQADYSKMEKGLIFIPDNIIDQLSQIVKFPIKFFQYQKPIYNQTEFFYRRLFSIARKDQMKLEAQFDIFRICIEELLSSVEVRELKIPAVRVGANNSPEDIARKVRTFLNVPRGPIDKIVKLLEKSGVIVFFMNNVPEKFTGTTIITASGQYVIVVNDSYPNDHKRLVIAHEFFHIISHMPIYRMDDFDRDTEDEADRFAAEFLMPEQDIRRDFASFKCGDLGMLKLFWKCPMESILKRAHTLSFINRAKFSKILNEIKKDGDSLIIPIDEPKTVNLMIDVHLNDLEYSTPELCSLLLVNQEVFESMLLRKQTRQLRIVS